MTDRPPPDLRQIWQEGPVAGLEAKRQALRTRRPRAGRGPPRRRRWRWLAAAGYGTLAFACLGLAALAFLLVAAPVDVIRDRLIERVKAHTGRQLVVAGPTSLALFPHLAVSLRDVALSVPDGMTGAPTVAMASLEVELRVWSLLTRQVVVERLTLRQPTIELSVDAQGRRSWDIATPGTGSSQPAPAGVEGPDQQRGGRSSEAASKATAALASLGIENVRVVDGTLRYSDEASRSRHEIKSLDLALTASDLAGPLEISGSLAWRGVQAGFAGTISPASGLLSDQPARLLFKVSGPSLEASYEGTLALAAGISLDGNIGLKARSARGLLDWLDHDAVPGGPDADAVAVTAHLAAANGQVTLSQLEASLGDTSATGSLAVDTRQARPRVGGELRISALDFGTILTRPRKRANASDKAASPPDAAPAPPSPHSRAGGKGWSEEPINLPALNLVDADLSVIAQRLVYKEMSTGQSKLALSLKGGIGKVTLEEIELYGGRGRGVLTLDATGEVLAMGTNLRLTGVSVLPLLTDALGFQWLEGRGVISLALAGQGLSERQIVETLNGKVDVAVASGAMTGVDVGRIVRTLQQARLPSLAFTAEDRTPFSEFFGTFDIANGKAKNQDLRIVSSHLQLAGEGVLDLGPRQIDYTLRAKIGGAAPEPGAVIKIGSLEIPIAVEGPWEKPAFKIKGQEQLTETLKQVGKRLKSRDVQEALEGLLGGDGAKRTKPRELLEKFLKKE